MIYFSIALELVVIAIACWIAIETLLPAMMVSLYNRFPTVFGMIIILTLTLACPCNKDCLEGCTGCENPICFCNVSSKFNSSGKHRQTFNLFQDATNDDNLDACLSKNSKALGQCILDCNDDTSCEAACVSTFKDNHSECPCQVFEKY